VGDWLPTTGKNVFFEGNGRCELAGYLVESGAVLRRNARALYAVNVGVSGSSNESESTDSASTHSA
jgi:hypothetical protein